MLKTEIISQLQNIVGKDAVLTSKEDLNSYSYDATTIWIHMPEVVVLPTNTEQISKIMKLANDNHIPVTARGGGTNVSGGSIPIKGGIVLCTVRMNKIISISKTNLMAIVEPGVILQDFNTALAKEKLMYPPDPQSFLGCTIGGTIAENAGGPYCLKYGVTKQYVLGLEVVLADGRIMKTGGVTVKNRMGYELMMLFTGSEGTLGIITKINLRLIPKPAATKTLLAVFDDMSLGGQAVSDILACGVVPAKVEFVDNFVIRKIEETSPMGLPKDANAMLLIQCDGFPATIEVEINQIFEILKKGGAREIKVARDAVEEAAYWKMRSGGFAAVYGAAKTVISEDVAVPRDKLAEFIRKLGEISKESGFFIQYLGHAGDGNLHPSVFTDINKKEEFARAQDTLEKIVDAALALGGVLSGEHGIGLEKQRFFNKAMDPVALELMKNIKKLMDPNNILNPGKNLGIGNIVMAKVKELTEIKKFQKDLDQCIKCGFCTFWCPVYQEEKQESAVARGKNKMIRGLVDGNLEFTNEFAERLGKCTLCSTCTANCPSKTNIPNVIVAARADMVKAKGIKFPYNIAYRWLLPRRKLFGNIVRFASWFQGLFMPRTHGKIRHLAFFLSALGKGRQIPEIAPKFFRELMPVVNKLPEGTKTVMTVGYFTGCMTDFVFPDVGKKIVNFLTKNGVEVIIPREQGCCGAPVFLGAGDMEAGRKFADTNVEAFKDVDYIITDCATCGSSMKDYKKFLADTPDREEAYAKFGGKIKDITEFLVDVLKLPSSSYHAVEEVKGKKVTWHDPCHLNRHMGIKEQPRAILKSIPEIEYVEMPNADRCCGMAGSFSIYYYDLSQKIADKKMAGIEATNADIVVTDCPGCEIQLIDNLTHHNKSTKVMHIMELLK